MGLDFFRAFFATSRRGTREVEARPAGRRGGARGWLEYKLNRMEESIAESCVL